MNLHDLVAQYVTFRKTLGERFRTNEQVLRSFCNTLGEETDIHAVGAEAVRSFLTGAGPVTRTWHVKYNALRGLYRYALSRGCIASTPLPSTVPKMPLALVPYIYSRAELQRLLGAAEFCERPCHVMEPVTLRSVLTLLYGAGLRPSEALALKLADVDLPAAVLTVRRSKFFKSRLVPLGMRLTQRLTDYATWRKSAHRPAGGEAPFFVGRTGACVLHDTLHGTFARLRTGARANETAHALVGDLDLASVPGRDASSVLIHGKGNKPRRCPLWSRTASELEALVSGRAPAEHVFLNRYGRPLTRFGIHTLVERYAARAAATVRSLSKKQISPHTIRHTTATHLLRASVDINTIRAWLGHVSLATTNVYAEVDLEMKAKALANCEVVETRPHKPWREETGLMEFLQSL